MGRKWTKPDKLKTTPLKVTHLLEAVMAYGSACENYGRAVAHALGAKLTGKPSTALWARAFGSRELAEKRLKAISEGWPDVESRSIAVEEESEADNEQVAENE